MKMSLMHYQERQTVPVGCCGCKCSVELLPTAVTSLLHFNAFSENRSDGGSLTYCVKLTQPMRARLASG